MAHPQSSPRGLFYKDTIRAQTTLEVGGTYNMTANSTGIVFSGGVKLSNKLNITAVSTGLKPGTVSSLPGAVDNGAMFGLISNSTGVALFINSTGTTHKYIEVTSVQRT